MIETNPPVLSTAHFGGSPASTMAGFAAMSPALIDLAHSFTLPTSPAGWLQIVFGVLALFMRG